MLVALYEQDAGKVGNGILTELKRVLAGQDVSIESKQINKVVTELQFRKRLGWVKHKG